MKEAEESGLHVTDKWPFSYSRTPGQCKEHGFIFYNALVRHGQP